MTPQIVSVTEFVAIINETMHLAFPSVVIAGEVAGWKVWQNRYVYFDIKDAKTTLSCFMPVYLVKTPVEDGMDVRIEGSPKLTDKGRFSFTVKTLELTGEGAIRRAFELLKAKFDQEGLFNPERKRPLPKYPHRIGLVTAPGSAAYADFMKIVNARWGGLDILVAPVQVQGTVAPDQITAAITTFNEQAHPVDVLVLIRGGGSLEDLQAFNSETVARAVASSRIPTLVGVGHEVDISLADLVADERAATPTDAAQRLVPDRREVLGQLTSLQQALVRAMGDGLAVRADQIEVLTRDLGEFTERPRQLLLAQSSRLERIGGGLESSLRHRLAALGQVEVGFIQSLRRQLADGTRRVVQYDQLLHAMSPRAVLGRGYAIARAAGKPLRSTAGIKQGTELVIELHQGIIDSTVTGTHHGNR